MKVSLIQMDVAFGEPEENLRNAEQLIRRAAAKGPDVIVLPEMWNTAYDLPRLESIADRNGEPCARRIASLARELKVNVVAGSIADRRQAGIFNTAFVFDRQGQMVDAYDKVHLFSLMQEPAFLQPGSRRCCFSLDGVRCGVLICFDLRFPELARALALDGARVIFVPAQWPRPRLHPWRVLLQARAIENQCFVIGVNRVGRSPDHEFFGHSLVVAPDGEVIFEGSDREEAAVVELDLDKVAEVRRHIPCLSERVEEVYG